MRAHRTSATTVRAMLATAVASAAVAAAFPTGTRAAAPGTCGVAQIGDVAGDGHHDNTDVTSAWLSERNGRLQAVIQLRQGVWAPAHDDSEAAGFAFLFDVGGATRYVRAEAPRAGAVRYDHGTWTRAGGFVSAGPTSGETTAGSGGTVTLDVPAQTGAVVGATLTRLFVLTYDGGDGSEPHWVDRGPGGTTPDGGEFGADFVVGSCLPQAPGTPPGTTPPPGTVPPPGTSPDVPVRTSAVSLRAPARLVGGGRARVSGTVSPARAGVKVRLAVTAAGRASTRELVTGADGAFSTAVDVTRRTRLRATAEGIGSQTLTVVVRSTATLAIRRARDGAAIVSGRVRPALPGRVLLLRADAARPAATTTTRAGRFRLRVPDPRPGRYQVVFVPRGDQAERSTSNTGVIR